MKFTLSIVIFLLSISICTAQKSGDQYLQEGKPDSAAYAFGTALMSATEAKVIEENAYKLASACALIYQVDTAFYFLNIALKDNYTLLPLTDCNFYSLSEDARWQQIENAQFKKFQEKNGALKEVEYAKKLLRLIMKDQALDYYMDLAKSYYMQNGNIPHWFYPLGDLRGRITKDNFENMKALIAENGWPTYSAVGELAADAPLLVINHHESDSVRKAYLAQIKEACLNGEGSCMEYAKIHDRILVNEGKLQDFGMQFRYNEDRILEPFPINNPEYVDQRRTEIGLEPLKDYLKRKINYNWEIAQKVNE
ncbi:MAG: hypothetical protein CMO01_15125 [Thalassobius sp.]|nr:hypothetical protein [Thalassovita sp.]